VFSFKNFLLFPFSSGYEALYGRADHTEALKVAPKLFFAATPQE
jgi:hypothetical protein